MIRADYADFITPAAVMAELDGAYAQAVAFDGDVKRAAPADFDSTGWSVWFASFTSFQQAMKSSWSIPLVGGTVDALFNSNIDQLRQYEDDLKGWVAQFSSLGGKATVKPTGSSPDWIAQLTGAIPWVVGGLALYYFGPVLSRIFKGRD